MCKQQIPLLLHPSSHQFYWHVHLPFSIQLHKGSQCPHAFSKSICYSIYLDVTIIGKSVFLSFQQKIQSYRETYIHDMQIYENKVYYVIGMFLDTRFIECVWVHLRRNHNNSSVVIQMTGMCMKLSTLAWNL